MKKLTYLIGAVMLTAFTLTSCGGNSVESDAKKMADLQCQAMELMDKAMAGDEDAMAEGEEIGKKAEAMAKELEEKYADEAAQEEFAKAFEKALEECK